MFVKDLFFMSDTFVSLKTVNDLQKEKAKFYIDVYQRGYRWTDNEVKDLLDDIREFSHAKRYDDNSFYCLQPIIITRADDAIHWKVIDGQQRLTTIYLIYSFYWVIQNPSWREELPFDLTYNDKDKLQQCIRIFREKEYDSSEQIDNAMFEYEEDIDCYYVIEAYKCICDYFHKLGSDPNTRNELNDMKKIFDQYMKIIWYEIVDCDVTTEVAVFSRINMGRIALTNAELIKALLLKNDGNDSETLKSTQMNIAVKWDEIEAQLSESSFWDFLVNDEKEDTTYATRIDFIFHVMARELNDGILLRASEKYNNEEPYVISETVNKDKFSFYVFSNYVRLLQKHPEEDVNDDLNYIEDIWDRVCEYYRMFKDWYKNIHWYHLIGFLVAASNNKYIDQIIELSVLYRDPVTNGGEGHKDHFESQLRKKITEVVFKKMVKSKTDCRKFIKDLNYPENANEIRKVLLLYNIAYIEACKENGRFPFEKYKDKKISWDLEHINAVSDARPDDDRRESEDNNRLQWLKKTAKIPEIDKITTPDGQSVQELVELLIEKKYYLSKYQPSTKDFIRVYEAVINYYGGTGEPDNSIGNLTLLDCGTNRSYKNDVFPLKRKMILERTIEDVFVPLCTRKVFMKAFVESGDLLRWSDIDKNEYTEEIITFVSNYLRLEDDLNVS